MTIQDTYRFFEKLKNETTQTSEIKMYEKFIHILKELRSREFSIDETRSMEAELDRLELESNSENRKKYFAKRLKEFKEYLKEKHALISARYYTNLYTSTGAAFGIVAGIIIGERFGKSLGIAVGISIGMLIGAAIGRSKDAKASWEGRIL